MSLSSLFYRPTVRNDVPLLPLQRSSHSTPYQTAPVSPNPQPLRASKMASRPVPQSDSLLTLSRQEAHLQKNLQSLLDAQSEGLLASFSGPTRDETSTGSRTPTAESGSRAFHKPKVIIPVRQPTKRKLGLRGARRGIGHAISELADLKDEEVRVLEDEITQRQEILFTVQGFERKCTCLQERIRNIESEDTVHQLSTLEEDEKALDSEIHEMETRLYEMKARRRHLLREINELNNSVQSKLSSYRSALELAEKDTKIFLARPPLQSTNHTTSTGIWSLPRERRTLEMAKDHYSEEQRALKDRVSAIKVEHTALEEGGVIWEEVVQEVTTVEKLLQEEMQSMQAPMLDKGSERSSKRSSTEVMKKILKTMWKTRSSLQSKLDLAEKNNWNLLVCCVGAELEAMAEGQAVLEGALETSQEGQIGKGEGKHNGGGLNEQEGYFDHAAANQQANELSSVERSEDEDDGPGPDFLISHHDD